MQLSEPQPGPVPDCQNHHHQRSPAETAGHPRQEPPAQLPGQGPEEAHPHFPHRKRLDIQRRLLAKASHLKLADSLGVLVAGKQTNKQNDYFSPCLFFKGDLVNMYTQRNSCLEKNIFLLGFGP